MSDPEWYYPHKDCLPSDSRAVALLVALRDGTFVPDIGRYYGPKQKWYSQTWGSDSAIVAWTNLPDFKDHTPIHEHDDLVGSPRGQS